MLVLETVENFRHRDKAWSAMVIARAASRSQVIHRETAAEKKDRTMDFLLAMGVGKRHKSGQIVGVGTHNYVSEEPSADRL